MKGKRLCKRKREIEGNPPPNDNTTVVEEVRGEVVRWKKEEVGRTP